ncbi:MAG: sigma-70 family RNA polymerase sigma factor [Candidatus Latescibacterota bacterium]
MAGKTPQEDDLRAAPRRRLPADDRLALLFPVETQEDRVEAQELRQTVHVALQQLTPQELRVIELRYQQKKSPGQVASQLGIRRQQMTRLERSGLRKLRQYLQEWSPEE